MTSGYTPVFGSIYQGTLCGKWPDAAVWASILPLCDRHGRIDYTPAAIVALTGWPLDLLMQGLEGLCQPDPHSRSDAEAGCRLRLIDPARSWGWVVVNHTKYREKARKASFDAERTASGADADRKRQERASRDVPRDPATSRSQTQTQTQTEEDVRSAGGLPPGVSLALWMEWEADRRERRKSMTTRGRKGLFKFLLTQPEADRAAIVQRSIDNGWQGFWPLSRKSSAPAHKPRRFDTRPD